MFRVLLAIVTVAAIFAWSPHRTGLGLADSVAEATRAVPPALVDAFTDTRLGPALAGAVLRRTVAEAGETGEPAGRHGREIPVEAGRADMSRPQ